MKNLTMAFGRKVFKSFLAAGSLRAQSVSKRLKLLNRFLQFLKSQRGEYVDLRAVSLADIAAYRSALQVAVSKRTGRVLCSTYRQSLLCTVKLFFKSLYVHDYLLTNPCSGFNYQERKTKRVREILTREEMARLLDSIELTAKNGLRDRVLFELLYGSGLRIEEARILQVADIDFERQLLFVHGKGGKPRLQPVSEVAMHFLKKYLSTQPGAPERVVFRGQAKGGLVSQKTLHNRFQHWLRVAGLNRPGLSLHSIRHAVATHLLDNGANIRYVQAFLGHESLKTTTLYTHLLFKNLKQIYKQAHPREHTSFQEVEPAYRERLAVLRARLTKRQAENAKRAAAFKACAERKNRSD